MSKKIKCLFSFVLVIFMLSFSTEKYYAKSPVAMHIYPIFSTYEEMMVCYNDNSQLKTMGDKPKGLVDLCISYWEYYEISFEEYCKIFNTVIESERFLYFIDDSEKKLDYINVQLYDYGLGEPLEHRLEYHYDNSTIIKIFFPTETNEIKALEEGGLTEYLKLRYPEEEEKGCGSSKQYEKYEATEIITAKDGTEYEFFMTSDGVCFIRYNNTPMRVELFRYPNVSKGETQKEANRKFFVELIKDMSISAYIPPEEDTEQETEQENEIESEADTENTTANG